jgi:hypothetical protein
LTKIYFWGSKTVKKGFLRISFFSCVFQRNFSQEPSFGGGLRNSCFSLLSQEFFAGIPGGQEFLHLQQIPLDSSGFLWIPPDSSGFLFLPNAFLLWPATKVGFLLSKYRLK